MKITTLRVPDDVDAALAAHCERFGATRNRVAVLALRAWLDESPPAAPLQPPADDREELYRRFVETFDAHEVEA